MTWYFYVSEKWGEYWSLQPPVYRHDRFIGSVESEEHPRKTLYAIQLDQAAAFGEYCAKRDKEILGR